MGVSLKNILYPMQYLSQIDCDSWMYSLNPAQKDLKGLTSIICYRQNSVIANIRNKKLIEGTVNFYLI